MSQPSSDWSSLTELLDQGRIKEVKPRSKVLIPGLGPAGYSGYITVDSAHKSNLFFWLCPCTKIRAECAPLVVYLNGGPGNSSLIGLFEEVGPLKVDENGKVSKRSVTWTDKFSVIFIDSPVGVGFSFCRPGGECKTNKAVADNLFSFLAQFLQLFPEYQGCDIYIGGISYAGKYVPALAYKIDREMDSDELPVKIRLKGIFIGSGLSDPGKMLPLYPDFLLSLGMITEKKRTEVSDQIVQAVEKHKNAGKHKEAVEDVMGIVFKNMSEHLGYEELDNVLAPKKHKWTFVDFLNKTDIQNALHVKPTKYASSVNNTVLEMAEDFFQGVVKELSSIMDHYKVLIFTGHMDLLVSVPMTEALLKMLPWSGRDEYLVAEKQKWDYEGEIAGYITKVKDFTRVVMRNAGHRTAIDQPAWTFDMMCKFIHDH